MNSYRNLSGILKKSPNFQFLTNSSTMLMPHEINRETDKLAAWNNNPESGVLQVIYLFFFLRLHLSFQPDIYLLLQSSSNPLFMCIVIIPLKFLNFQFQPFGTRRLVEHKNQSERETLYRDNNLIFLGEISFVISSFYSSVRLVYMQQATLGIVVHWPQSQHSLVARRRRRRNGIAWT